MTSTKQHYLLAIECPNPAKHTGDTVSINIVLATKMSNIYDLSGNQKCLQYEFYELLTKMSGDTVSTNIVLAAKNEPHLYNV